MKFLLLYILLPLFYLTLYAQAYWIDDSCIDHRDAQTITTQIHKAFKVIENMAVRFDNWGSVDGMDADERRLFNLLLGGGANNYASARCKSASSSCLLRRI